MRELKILGVVVFFSLIVYLGVETYAHSVMHKHVDGGTYDYKDLPAIQAGNATNGESLVMSNCVACHSIESKGLNAPMDAVMASASYGVNPPDLSNAGAIYDAKYLAAFIKNPAKASKVAHKFEEAGKAHPMPSYNWMSDSDIADMVTYLQSISKNIADMTPKEVFVDACGRCHGIRYDNKVMGEQWTQIGQKPRFKFQKDSLAFDIKVIDYKENLTKYMGKLPPDLSTIIVARSNHFLETFIEDPQAQLEGTAMPAVGLNKEGYNKVMTYLTDMGDPSKKDREAYGPWFLGYLIILAILAYLWKKSVWRKLK